MSTKFHYIFAALTLFVQIKTSSNQNSSSPHPMHPERRRYCSEEHVSSVGKPFLRSKSAGVLPNPHENNQVSPESTGDAVDGFMRQPSLSKSFGAVSSDRSVATTEKDPQTLPTTDDQPTIGKGGSTEKLDFSSLPESVKTLEHLQKSRPKRKKNIKSSPHITRQQPAPEHKKTTLNEENEKNIGRVSEKFKKTNKNTNKNMLIVSLALLALLCLVSLLIVCKVFNVFCFKHK